MMRILTAVAVFELAIASAMTVLSPTTFTERAADWMGDIGETRWTRRLSLVQDIDDESRAA